MAPEEPFSNEQVELSTLPDFQRVEMTPVPATFLPWALISQSAFWLIFALGTVIVPRLPFVPMAPSWWLTLAVVGMWGIVAVLTVFDARARGWALREQDLIYRYGVIWRKTVIVPFARIQHVEAVHGPLERRLDLMRLKCFTAGGQTADLTVKGLDRASARRVRQYLLEQIGESAEHPSESGAPETDTVEDGDRRDPD